MRRRPPLFVASFAYALASLALQFQFIPIHSLFHYDAALYILSAGTFFAIPLYIFPHSFSCICMLYHVIVLPFSFPSPTHAWRPLTKFSIFAFTRWPSLHVTHFFRSDCVTGTRPRGGSSVRYIAICHRFINPTSLFFVSFLSISTCQSVSSSLRSFLPVRFCTIFYNDDVTQLLIAEASVARHEVRLPTVASATLQPFLENHGCWTNRLNYSLFEPLLIYIHVFSQGLINVSPATSASKLLPSK